MKNVVQPRFDFQSSEQDGRLEFKVKSHRTVAMALMPVLGAVPGAVAFICLIAGTITGSGIAVLIGLVAAFLSFLCFRAALSKKMTTVIFDKDSVTVGKKSYLLSHVSGIGYDSVANNPTIVQYGGLAGTISASAAVARQAAGHYIYIMYGTDRIPIVTGLTPQNVDVIYDQIVKFLGQFGHQYGPGST